MSIGGPRDRLARLLGGPGASVARISPERRALGRFRGSELCVLRSITMNAPVPFIESRADNGTRVTRYRIRPPALLAVREAGPTPESVSDWRRVHERVVALGAERAAREHELCRWLRAAERLGVHARMGFGSLGEYAERLLGLSRRGLEERLRVARALETLPELDRAFARGELSWSAVRESSRVATAETEGAWRRWAEGRRLREVEQTVAARHPGQRPEGRADPALVKHRLRYDVRAETMALFRDLEARVRADLGEASDAELDDDMVLNEIARRALGGPSDEGRASYQVAVTRCPDCLRVSFEAGGHSHEVDAVVGDMVECDAQQLGSVDAAGAAPTHVGPPAAEGEREIRAPAGTSPRVGAEAAEPSPRGRRASQTIPPATRRAVMRREGGHCAVPGCSNHRWLDVHHVAARAEGGSHDPANLVVLCGAHHRAVHLGSLFIEATPKSGLRFRHADGTPYGGRPHPGELEVSVQVLGALEHLGFGASRARALVDEVRRRGAPEGTEAFLRAALVLA